LGAIPATPQEFLELRLAYKGWTWRWEGDDLVLKLPGWVAPPVRLVAVQLGLFDGMPVA
jgi:hypothetical protein